MNEQISNGPATVLGCLLAFLVIGAVSTLWYLRGCTKARLDRHAAEKATLREQAAQQLKQFREPYRG